MEGTLLDKIRGVIFGAALGDSVGLSTEFMNKETATKLYGDGPIKFGKAEGHEFYRDNHRRKWHENDFTDDTDQMLLILQCLLSSNGRLVPEQFAFRLKEWTEIGFPELSNKACFGVGSTVGSVVSHSEFVTNPHKAAYDVWKSKGCNLAANGAVMRTSVLGIPLFFDESKVVWNAINCAKVTHADPRCIFSSVVVSVLISRMVRSELGIGEKCQIEDCDRERLLKLVTSKTTNENCNEAGGSSFTPKVLKPVDKPESLFQSLRSSVRQFTRKSETETHFDFAKHNPTDPLRLKTFAKCSNDPENRFSADLYGPDDTLMSLVDDVVSDYKFLIHTVPESSKWIVDVQSMCPPKHLHELKLDDQSSIGYTLKCLGAALFCFSRQKASDLDDGEFFTKIITELTLEAGDADTNAAVAGALLGCRLGYKGLPDKWLDGLRHRKFLLDICDKLLELVVKQIPDITS